MNIRAEKTEVRTSRVAPIYGDDLLSSVQAELSNLKQALDECSERELADQVLEQKQLLRVQEARIEQQEDELKHLRARQRESENNPTSTLPAGRHERIRRARILLREKRAALRLQAKALETQRKSAREIINQRETLRNLQRMVGDAEQRMIRRWGIQHAFNWAIPMLICLGLLLGMSYFAAESLSLKLWAASSVVRHLGQSIEPTEQWAAQEKSKLVDPQFVSLIANQLRQSQQSSMIQPAALNDMLNQSMFVTAPAPNLISIELHGPNRDSLRPILDQIVKTYAAAPHDVPAATKATLTASNTSETPIALTHGRKQIEQHASLFPYPVQDNYRQLLAIFFGCSVVVSMLFTASLATAMIINAKRTSVTKDEQPANDEAQWEAYHESIDSNSAKHAAPLF